MTVADYIVKFLSDKGISTIFMITGGQAMFLNDAVYRNKKIKPVFCHHEQAVGMAAEAYGRVSSKPGVAMVTAGPGAINVLNGVVGAYADSAPLLVISGQSPVFNVEYMKKTKIRQIGLQGINTEPVVKSVTKFFKSIDDPAQIEYVLEQAYFLATTPRTGPAWIEVPLDIQRMQVPAKLLKKYNPSSGETFKSLSKNSFSELLKLIYLSKRPLILAGQGIRLSKAADIFTKLVERLKIPIITTRLGIDLIESNNPLFVGRPGLYADRGANLAVQNADLILSIGARLDTGLVGYDAKDWGRHAKKIVVEIDPEELEKPGINIDIKINSDAGEFINQLLKKADTKKLQNIDSWRRTCSLWRSRYPTVLAKYKKEKQVNSYYLTQRLSNAASPKDTILVDTSSAFHVACQAWEIKKGQRLITTGGISTMGYWVAGIGACLAAGSGRTIIITGDGSLQMNIQELATIKQNKLPIKIFIINNGGYLLIRHTQKTHMEGRYMGESPKSGLWCPDPVKIADAYGIYAVNINNTSQLDAGIKKALSYPGPVICNVESPHWQMIMPRISSSKQPDGSMVSRPYEDLFPFLSADELASNMIAQEDKSE